jgi:murein DD-endopeptidase MepM/ murein hydrolase activator NlpD
MDKYNFQIIPPHSGNVKRFSLNDKHLKWLIGGVGAFLLLNILFFGFSMFFWFKYSDEAISKVENDKLANQLEYTATLVDSLEKTLTRYSGLSREVRDYADLPPVCQTQLAYGIGGPQLPHNDHEPLLVARSRFITYKLDSLIHAAEIEHRALLETQKEFEKNKKRFAQTPSIRPMRGYISSGFGKRLDPFTGVWKMHEGIDICAPKGTPVYATADGRVKFAGWYHGYGKTVRIDHTYYETKYGHLEDIKVQPGQKVKRGDLIGTCGKTGYTTGVHLHYEVLVSGRPVDPMQYIYPDVVVD